MKQVLTVTEDGSPMGTLVMIASRKGYILYDREKDRTKRKRPTGKSNTGRAWSNTQPDCTTRSGICEEPNQEESGGAS